MVLISLTETNYPSCIHDLFSCAADMRNLFWKLSSWYDEFCCLWPSILRCMLERFVLSTM